MVSEVPEIRRIRFTSPHPKDFPSKLIDVVTDNEKACKQIHLPLQSGNDRILDMMNRTYSQQEYFDLINLLRNKIPGLAISTDVMVGFPTETDEEYQDTLKVMREVLFDSAFMFKYSERKQTIAQRKFPDDVPEEVKTERLIELVEMQRKINYEKNQKHLGETFEVLVEGRAKKPDQMMGRNDANKIVVFPEESQKSGNFVKVKIGEATPNTLIGTVCK
jgi:tRNA-2-methylthio-N6-dimethylallyladenosine synthase